MFRKRPNLSPLAAFAAALGLVSLLTACGGSGGSSPIIVGPTAVPGTPTPSPTPALGSLSVSIAGSLTSVGSTATITASQPGYSGPFTFTSSDGTIVGLATKTSSVNRTPKGAPQTVTSNSAVTATVLSLGTASITVSGGGGQAIAPSQLTNIVIATPTPSPSPTPSPTPSPSPSPSPTPGAITLSPSSLNFLNLTPQTFTASAPNYTGVFTASSTNCAPVVSATISSLNSFTVTPIGAGQCSITISNTLGATAVLSIGVTLTTVGGS